MNNKTYYQILSKPFSVYLVNLPKTTQKIYLRLVVKAGRCFAPTSNKELPHLLEHYLANQFMQNREDYSAFVDFQHLDFFLLAKKRNFDKKLNFFLMTLLQPDFSNENILKNEKKAIANEVNGNSVNIENIVYRSVVNTRFREKTNYFLNSKLTPADNKNTLKDIDKYYHQFCHSENITLFVGAHQPSTQLIEIIKKLILAIKTYNGKKTEFPLAHFSEFTVTRKEFQTERVHLTLAWPGPNQMNNLVDLCSLNCAIGLLVQGQEGRLFQSLRVENSLVYGVNGLTQFLNKVGFFAISTAVEAKDTFLTVKIIIDEINKIKDGKIDKKQLKRYISENNKSIKKGWQNNWTRFDWFSQNIIHQQKPTSLEKLLNINKKFLNNPLLISTVLKKYLDHQHLNVILVGKNINKIDPNSFKDLVFPKKKGAK